MPVASGGEPLNLFGAQAKAASTQFNSHLVVSAIAMCVVDSVVRLVANEAYPLLDAARAFAPASWLWHKAHCQQSDICALKECRSVSVPERACAGQAGRQSNAKRLSPTARCTSMTSHSDPMPAACRSSRAAKSGQQRLDVYCPGCQARYVLDLPRSVAAAALCTDGYGNSAIIGCMLALYGCACHCS